MAIYLLLLPGWSAAIPSFANAQGIEDLAIEWNSKSGCGSLGEVKEELAKIVGETWQGTFSHQFKCRAFKEDEKWTASLEVVNQDETFSRTISVASCETAVKVVALLIAITLDPALALSSEDTEILTILEAPEPVPEKPEAPQEAESKDPQSDAEPSDAAEPTPEETGNTDEPSTPGPRPGVGSAFAADIGSVPGLGLGFSLTTSLLIGIFRGDLTIKYLVPRESDISGNDSGTIRAHILASSLGGGFRFDAGGFFISPIAGLTVNTIWAESQEIVDTKKGAASYWAAQFTLAFERRVFDIIFLVIRPAICVPFSRPRFEVEGIGVVHRPSVIAGELDLGLFFIF